MTRIKTTTSNKTPDIASENAETLVLNIDSLDADGTSQFHSLGKGRLCDTDSRGYPTPKMHSKVELILDASEGFIPLWKKNTLLKWRFQERSLSIYEDPEATKSDIRKLFSDALLEWGDAVPVKFKEDNDLWDFEIVVRDADQCNPYGCVLASAFFPDSGRHEFVVYPKLFVQERIEQVDTFTHEIGHIFGLRHFFAQVSEKEWPAEIFGTQSKFSIMNYGVLSTLTPADKNDLKTLYKSVWSGDLTSINGTPIKLISPYSAVIKA